MESSRRAQQFGLAALLAALAMLAACAPFGVQAPPPISQSALATTTAAAYATHEATGAASASSAGLPALHPDAGWVAEVEIANGAEFNGSGVIGGAPGSATAATTETFGYFTLSSAATVRIVFACQSSAGVHASVEVSVGDAASGTIECTSTVASTSNQSQLPASLVGHKLPVTVTVSTDSVAPDWNLLVEQPK